MSEGAHPSDEKDMETLFNFPYLSDAAAVEFLNDHGRVFFIVRGLPCTGKSVLSAMLQERYPVHEIYWAHKMFKTPVPIVETHSTIRDSHRLCHEKIEGFMKENVPVIINRNSNVRVREVSHYLLLAAKYGYTTILADTSYRFSVVPEELVAANERRLGEHYVRMRCDQWESVHPMYTGWFLSPADALFLFKRFGHIFDLLSESGWSPPKVLHPEGQPFCLGRRCWFGQNSAEKEYCDSKEVNDAYGTVHTLKIVGYAVTHGFALALVVLDETQAKLIGQHDADDSDESVTSLFSKLNFLEWEPTRCEIKLSDVVEDDGDAKIPPITDRVKNVVAGDVVSFIILGSCSESPEVPFVASKELPGMWKALCERMSISEHGVTCEEKKCVGDVIAYRAHQDYLILDKGVELSGVFTGYHQPYSRELKGPCTYYQASGRCRFGDTCMYKHQARSTFKEM